MTRETGKDNLHEYQNSNAMIRQSHLYSITRHAHYTQFSTAVTGIPLACAARTRIVPDHITHVCSVPLHQIACIRLVAVHKFQARNIPFRPFIHT